MGRKGSCRQFCKLTSLSRFVGWIIDVISIIFLILIFYAVIMFHHRAVGVSVKNKILSKVFFFCFYPSMFFCISVLFFERELWVFLSQFRVFRRDVLLLAKQYWTTTVCIGCTLTNIGNIVITIRSVFVCLHFQRNISSFIFNI